MRKRVFANHADPRAVILHTVSLFGAFEVGQVALREGAHVHHEDVHIEVFLVLLGDDRLFCSVHAAHCRAIVVSLIAGADAL